MQNTQQPCHSPIVTLGLDPRVQRRVTERLPWMLGSSPSMTIGYVAKGVRTEEHHHGSPALRDRRRKVAPSLLAPLGAAARHAIQRCPRLQAGLGPRGLEDPRPVSAPRDPPPA